MPPFYQASDVMVTTRALLNDTQNQLFTNNVQLPYLKKAFRELREYCQLNNVPVTSLVSTALSIPANTSEVSYVSIPSLPQDFVEPRQLWERSAGTDPWIPLQRVETLPYSLDGQPAGSFMLFAWQDNKIKLFPCNRVNDLKMDYISQLAEVVDENTTIPIINGQTFLENRCAALCAQYVSEDKERSNDLNTEAEEALYRLTSIESKGKQAILYRRRPFRQAYKSRGIF